MRVPVKDGAFDLHGQRLRLGMRWTRYRLDAGHIVGNHAYRAAGKKVLYKNFGLKDAGNSR